MRIDRAFCIELNKEVDIYAARENFFSQTKLDRFNFLCSDPECRAKKPEPVRIRGALHNKIPEEKDLSVTPYFATFANHEHIETCEWLELEEALVKNKKNSELAKNINDFKDTQFITRFIPESESDDQQLMFDDLESTKSIKNIANREERLEARYQKFVKNGSTTRSLDCLVSFYEHARSIDKLYLELNVKGFGSFKLSHLFNHIKSYFYKKNYSIFYGGASVKRLYSDKSFSLIFYDEVNGIPIHLYVSANNINSCPKVGNYLLRLLADLRGNKSSNHYLKVYFVGELIQSEKVKSYDIKLSNLNNLSIRLVPRKSTQNKLA
jgi:hypothetical protein